MLVSWNLRRFSDVDMDVSENSGTPKSSILIGFSIINHPFWGTPIFGNTHMGDMNLARFWSNYVAAERSWQELRMCLTATAKDKLEVAKVKYDCLRHWQSQSFGWRRFCAWGIPLCGKAACEVLSLSHKMYTTWCKHLSDGHREPPADQRKTQRNLLEKNVQAGCNANVLLTWLYEHVAEQLCSREL